MDEQTYEKHLRIKTTGEQKAPQESTHYHRYEPTSYAGLELLAEHYAFTTYHQVVDFGCGKGRLAFYLQHFFGATVTGVEMNTFFYKQALENKKEYLKKHKKNPQAITFVNCLAEEYEINPDDNAFYFFNPFSLQIFITVIGNILKSVEKKPRIVDLLLYYPSYEYRQFLETSTPFLLLEEIPLPSVLTTDPRNRFLIYRYTC